MTVGPKTDPEQALQRGGDELEERLHHVDEDIDEAKKQLRARREGDGPLDDVAGDWEDTDDAGGGEDPSGFDDPEAEEEDEEE
ncbi:MAG TPA: hypothetical protein VFT42_08055 [Solirubrobacteraceae bacterium]|nr:hypothetical protein [Solirubrobacteraceae bacterium]